MKRPRASPIGRSSQIHSSQTAAETSNASETVTGPSPIRAKASASIRDRMIAGIPKKCVTRLR